MRPIDADALIKRWNEMTIRGRTEFDQEIMLAPTIEPKRGEWLWDNGYFCSECHGEAFSQKFTILVDEPMYFRSDFCPNCGAQMKGADDGTR